MNIILYVMLAISLLLAAKVALSKEPFKDSNQFILMVAVIVGVTAGLLLWGRSM